MRTGTTRTSHRPALLVVVLLSVFALVSLAGCDANGPVAAPTSTLSEQKPSEGSPEPTTEVDIPDYETDLDLSDKEKEAVDGALVAFAGYFYIVNKAYSGDFSAANRFPDYASGDALESIRGDVKVIKNGTYRFSGTVEPSKIVIDQVKSNNEELPSSVTVTFCFDLSKWSLLPRDEAPDSEDSDFVSMAHRIQKKSGNWTVAKQSLRERQC